MMAFDTDLYDSIISKLEKKSSGISKSSSTGSMHSYRREETIYIIYIKDVMLFNLRKGRKDNTVQETVR